MKVGAGSSSWSRVLSSVPQGTVLGPLLFLIFIGDLGGDIDPEEATILKYVDDTKILKEVHSMEDVEQLQESLESLYQWQRDNNMEWNGGKFQLLRIGPHSSIKDSTVLFTLASRSQ